MVEMRPVTTINKRHSRTSKRLKLRPLSESGLDQFGNRITLQTWENVYSANTAHEKASIFQKELMQSLDKCVSEKIKKSHLMTKPGLIPN